MSSAIRFCLGVALFALTFTFATGQQLHADSKQERLEDNQAREENTFAWFTTGYGLASLQHYSVFMGDFGGGLHGLRLRGIVGAKILNAKLDASLMLGVDMPYIITGAGVRLARSELALQFTAYDNNTIALFPYLVAYVDPSLLGKIDGLAGELGFVAQVNQDIDTKLGKINIGAKSDLYGSDATTVEGIIAAATIWSGFMPAIAKSKLEVVVSLTYSRLFKLKEDDVKPDSSPAARLRSRDVGWGYHVGGVENRIGMAFAITDNLLISNDFALYFDGFYAGWAGGGSSFVNVAQISYDLF